MPIYRNPRQPNTWRVVVWARNRQHERSITGSKKDAEAFEARLRVEFEAGLQMSTRTAPTFSSFCVTHYRPHAEKHLKESTWQKVRIYQLATLESFFGPKKLTDITTLDIERYKMWRAVKPSSVNNELRVLGTVLRWAGKLGFPAPKLEIKKLPVRGKGRARVWSTDQALRLLSAAQELYPEMVGMLTFLLNTGCRKGEAIAAEWGWIDFENGLIRIPATEFWEPKNGLPREVPLADKVKAVLQGPRRHPQFLFPTRHGNRFAEFPKDVYNAIRKAAGLVGGPHTTRHTFASHFLQAVPDLPLLARILGHSSTRITEIYSHLLPDHLSRARNAVSIGPALKSLDPTLDQKAKMAKSSK